VVVREDVVIFSIGVPYRETGVVSREDVTGTGLDLSPAGPVWTGDLALEALIGCCATQRIIHIIQRSEVQKGIEQRRKSSFHDVVL